MGREIRKTTLGPRSIHVSFDDGHASEFHYIWLRDNCRCLDCRHPQTLERTFDLLSVPEDIRAGDASVTDDGALEIVWSNDSHRSVYHQDWLREHCYCASDLHRSSRSSPRVLWDASLSGRIPQVAHDDVMNDDDALLGWLRLLRDRGLALVTGAPTEPLQVLRVAERIAFPRRTNFGVHFDVVSMVEPNSNAYTALPLRCHTDLPNWEQPPGFQFLHCLVNEAEGGESVLVDGFRVADALRSEDREAFELMTQVPLDFHFEDDVSDLRSRAPAIGLDHDGEVTEVRFSIAVMGTLSIPGDRMVDTYRAYRKLAALFRDPRFTVRHALAPGELIVFDNRRVLHGRTGFDPVTGRRHLQGAYVDRDLLFSRIRTLERKTRSVSAGP